MLDSVPSGGSLGDTPREPLSYVIRQTSASIETSNFAGSNGRSKTVGTLSESLDELTQKNVVLKCQTGLTLQSLEPDDAKTLSAVIADPAIDASSIVKWLSNNKIRLSIDSLRRHRRGYCNCSRVSL